MSKGLLKLLAGVTAAIVVCTTSTASQAFGLTSAERYVDAVNYPDHEDGWDTFYRLEDRLFRDFNDICGDTFCEGEYSNIQALRYRCSIERETGLMGECVWVFAGSNQEIDPVTGLVIVDARVWRCKTPLAPNTKSADFFKTLANSRYPLHEPLPGSRDSIYDGLTDCL